MSDLSGDAFVEMAEKITTKAEFVTFANALLDNFRCHPEEWANNSLELFLLGLVGFARDSDGFYANLGVTVDPTRPSWRAFADILHAARVYE